MCCKEGLVETSLLEYESIREVKEIHYSILTPLQWLTWTLPSVTEYSTIDLCIIFLHGYHKRTVRRNHFHLFCQNILDILTLPSPKLCLLQLLRNSTNILKIKPYFQTILSPWFFSLTQFSIRIQLLKVTLVLSQSSYTHRTTGWPLSWSWACAYKETDVLAACDAAVPSPTTMLTRWAMMHLLPSGTVTLQEPRLNGEFPSSSSSFETHTLSLFKISVFISFPVGVGYL